MVELAEEYGKTPAQILVRWRLQVGAALVPKASQDKHLVGSTLGSFPYV